MICFRDATRRIPQQKLFECKALSNYNGPLRIAAAQTSTTNYAAAHDPISVQLPKFVWSVVQMCIGVSKLRVSDVIGMSRSHER